MRFSKFVMLGLLAVTFSTAATTAQADNSTTRSFGTYHCKQQFSCSNVSSSEATSLASACSSQGLGANADFSSASLDGSNCMTGPVGSNGRNSSSARCCVVNLEGDNCAMDCTFLLN